MSALPAHAGAEPPTLGPASVSAVVVVRNEEAVIERCLRSLGDVVNEIVLVHDGECEDRTLEIAREFGARVFVRPFTGNPEHHTVFGYKQARGGWLLNIDADEFLSEELRASLRELVARDDVNGYWLLWRMWNGERYVTERGPFKLVLLRRHATRMLGLLQSDHTVSGRTERLMLQLEHRPLYNSLGRHAMLSKWRRWARIHAAQLVRPRSELAAFNVEQIDEWPRWRRGMYWFSPVLFLPYGAANAALAFWRDRGYYSWRENVRLATATGIYNAMVMAYVARHLYLGMPEAAERS